MNTKTKRTLLISTIIILLVVNISALSTIIYNNKVRAKKLAEINMVQEELRERGMRKYFQEELKLTDNQIEEYRALHTKYAINSREIVDQLREKRHDMMIEIAKINPNPRKLDQTASEIGLLHYELKKLTISHFMELKDMCNKEQQEALHKMFIQMLSNQDGDRMDRGNRGRDRNDQRRHRQRNN